jgi:hypothetical protein
VHLNSADQQPTPIGDADAAEALAHDPEKLVLDLIADGHRFSEKIMRRQNVGSWF